MARRAFLYPGRKAIAGDLHRNPNSSPAAAAIVSVRFLRPNHVRLRLVPDATIALGMMVLSPSQEIAGQAVEMVACCTQGGPSEVGAYERILGDAMAEMRLYLLGKTTLKKHGASSIRS